VKGIQERVKAILDEATGQDLNSWEKNFLRSLKDRGNTTVSEKQEACLKKIEDKLKLQEEEEDGNSVTAEVPFSFGGEAPF
jgi:trehalose-6-phosphate synthase